MKKFLFIPVTCILAMLSAAEVRQVWVSAPKGNVKLSCGEYSMTSRLSNNGRISQFSFQGKELFTSPGSTQLGTLYETPFPREKDTVLTLTVDGKVPAEIGSEVSGKEIILERTGVYGDIRIFSRYTLNASGLRWAVKYRIETVAHKARYFYLFTMPWSRNFTEFAWKKGGQISCGKFSDSKKWLLCDNMDTLVLFSPSQKVAAVSKVITPIPVESRRHTLWDLPHFHKYFLFHQRPEWKAGYESPEYVMHFSAFPADENSWKTIDQ